MFFLTSCDSFKKTYNRHSWRLSTSEQIVFYHARSFDFGNTDHDKVFKVTDKNGKTTSYRFGGWHSGYDNVELRISRTGTMIWLIDKRDGKIGGTLNLVTGKFLGEQIPATYLTEYMISSSEIVPESK